MVKAYSYLYNYYCRYYEMGCFGLGVTRILQAGVEVLNDGNNIRWPKLLHPYQVCVISQKVLLHLYVSYSLKHAIWLVETVIWQGGEDIVSPLSQVGEDIILCSIRNNLSLRGNCRGGGVQKWNHVLITKCHTGSIIKNPIEFWF